MKNLLFLLLGILLFLQSCLDAGDVCFTTYQLYNQTERTLKIDYYNRSGSRVHTDQIIGKGLIFERSVDERFCTSTSPASAFDHADSIAVIYDNEKIQCYYYYGASPEIDGNRHIILTDNDNYELISNDLYRFNFTEEDYENAADLDDNAIEYARWEIVNGSDYPILMRVYMRVYNSNDVLSQTITLSNEKNIWTSENYRDSKPGPPSFSVLDRISVALGGDSLNVIFDNKKMLNYKYYNLPGDPRRNPLNRESYSIIKASDTQYIYQYIFTNEDYENATDIE